MALMLTYIAGVNHRPGSAARLAAMIPGEALVLFPELANKFDKNAVAVYDGNLQLGYIPAVDAPAVKKALAAGPVKAVFRGAPATTSIAISW